MRVGIYLVPPLDHVTGRERVVQDLLDALVRPLHDDDLRREMVARGLRRARQLTWDRAARNLLSVYREVAAEG